MTEDFGSIKAALNHIGAKTRHQPIRVKLNQQWAEKHFVPVVVNGKGNKVTDCRTIFGIPFEFDDSIETFEFVYVEGRY